MNVSQLDNLADEFATITGQIVPECVTVADCLDFVNRSHDEKFFAALLLMYLSLRDQFAPGASHNARAF